jgi:putative lipoprotein
MSCCRGVAVGVLAVLALSGLSGAQNGSAATMPSTGRAPGTSQMVSGTVAYRERIALPPDAAIEVKLQDVSRQDAPAQTIGSTIFAPGNQQVPLPFQIQYNPGDINPAHRYQVSANISVNGKLMFISTTAYPVLTNGAPSQVAIMLQQASAPATTATGTKLLETHWELAELNGKPAAPGQGQQAHLVLHKKGKLSGSSGCNTLAGTYIAEQGALQFTPAASTMKMCSTPVMEQEQAFFAAMKATTKYQIEGNTLELLNGDQVLAKFQAGEK